MWLATEPPGSSWLYACSAWVTGVCHHTLLFSWGLETWIQDPTLNQQALPCRAISLDPNSCKDHTIIFNACLCWWTFRLLQVPSFPSLSLFSISLPFPHHFHFYCYRCCSELWIWLDDFWDSHPEVECMPSTLLRVLLYPSYWSHQFTKSA